MSLLQTRVVVGGIAIQAGHQLPGEYVQNLEHAGRRNGPDGGAVDGLVEIAITPAPSALVVREQAGDGLQEIVVRKRFAHVAIHAGGAVGSDLLRQDVRRHGEHGNMRHRAWESPDETRGLHPVHAWHLDVHQDEVETPLLHRSHGGFAIDRDLDRVPRDGQHGLGEFPVHGEVVHEEDVCVTGNPGQRGLPTVLVGDSRTQRESDREGRPGAGFG